ncbi:MAG TPA: phenylalanine--tRNA ligase beta subunit-related protein [Aggregatilineales bacterium]|nr:phenylalanine--tRNA ligase beta subunit-related protein [Aggregatilineales bacterium]
MAAFRYHADILARYPSVVGGVILVQRLTNISTSADLLASYQAEQQKVLIRVGKTPLSEIESLAAWRGAFRVFGIDPTQYRSAAEALLRRLTKQGSIPSINTLVDIGNLVSIRYALPVAVFDTQAVQGPVTVHFADGSESFTPLGERAREHPEPGEVIFSDAGKMVLARRWCWRQSDESAARGSTVKAIVTVEAHHAGGHTDVKAALDDLVGLLGHHAGGVMTSGVLDSSTPALSD